MINIHVTVFSFYVTEGENECYFVVNLKEHRKDKLPKLKAKL